MTLEKISFMFIHIQNQHFHVEQDTLQGFLLADQTAAVDDRPCLRLKRASLNQGM